MKRTGATPIIGLAAVGGVVGFLLEQWTTMTGLALVVPPLSAALTLVVLAILVVTFAVPVRRAVKGRSSRPVDPFRATRVVVLAQASSLVGSLLSGFSLGMLAYFLTRSIVPDAGSVVLVVASVVGALALLIGGLIAEFLCTIPKDDTRPKGDEPDDDAEPASHAHL